MKSGLRQAGHSILAVTIELVARPLSLMPSVCVTPSLCKSRMMLGSLSPRVELYIASLSIRSVDLKHTAAA